MRDERRDVGRGGPMKIDQLEKFSPKKPREKAVSKNVIVTVDVPHR